MSPPTAVSLRLASSMACGDCALLSCRSTTVKPVSACTDCCMNGMWTSANADTMWMSTPAVFLCTTPTRTWPLSMAGGLMCGKLTALCVLAERRYAVILSKSSSAMARWHSMVLPDTNGDRIVFGHFCSGELQPLASSESGMSGNTSTAAPRRWPSLSAAASASMSTASCATPLLMSSAPGRILAMRSLLIRCRVCAACGTAITTTSLRSSSSSSVSTLSALPSGILGTTSWNITTMPNDSASTDSCEPTWP
mmetsp:Transcript_37346/g.91536  ORF Transcript_37346/g.91536 Transcript_37346/m.91536 type:complete len:252 (-) Transcript_37346:200-955(-)